MLSSSIQSCIFSAITAGKMKPAAVLYHYPCPDGAFAALAAHLYFSAASLPVSFFPNTVYEPIRAENLPLEDFGEVYMLDFVGPAGFVAEISHRVKRVIILDHHKTALEMFQESASVVENMTRVIDMERSGATIAYDYFREKIRERTMAPGSELVPVSEIERVNQLFRYIEDADLWRWALPNSKAFHSGFNDIKLEYNVNLNTELFNQLLELDPQSIIRQGQASLLCKQKLIDDILEQSYEIALGGGSLGHCLAVNADSISNLRSELGHQLANKSANQKLRGIGAVVYKVPDLENDQLLKISLRSIEIEDTTVISQKYGGGGHRNASSFMLSSSKFESWKVRNGLVAY